MITIIIMIIFIYILKTWPEIVRACAEHITQDQISAFGLLLFFRFCALVTCVCSSKNEHSGETRTLQPIIFQSENRRHTHRKQKKNHIRFVHYCAMFVCERET